MAIPTEAIACHPKERTRLRQVPNNLLERSQATSSESYPLRSTLHIDLEAY